MKRHSFILVPFVPSTILLLASCSCPAPTTNPPPAPPVKSTVLVTYSASTTSHIGEAHHTTPGHTYLVIDLFIENKGYESVSVNPFSLYVVIDRVEHGTHLVLPQDPLTLVQLGDGDSTSGKVVFEVPEEAASGGYELKCPGWKAYQVEWTRH